MKEIKTDLGSYNLYFNGLIEPKHADTVHEFLLYGIEPNKIVATELTEDIKLHNSLVDDLSDRIVVDLSEDRVFDKITPTKYLLPSSYQDLDLESFVFEAYRKSLNGQVERIKEVDRIHRELEEIKKRNVENLFRTIIFIVDEFKRNNVVFGVGRGSSCASYILFLLGLNLVNPLKYGIPFEEFFHN